MARNTEPGMGKKREATSGTGTVSRYQRASSVGTARWGLVDSARLTDCLDALQSNGDAALLGCTRDGGVLVLTVCSGETRVKFYARTEDEMDAHLSEITEMAQNRSGT